jgi:hypothetical protein
MGGLIDESTPQLADYNNFQDHFEGICERSIKDTVARKLKGELRNLEGYLLSQDQQNLNLILTTYARDGEEHVYESPGGLASCALQSSTGKHPKALLCFAQNWRASMAEIPSCSSRY